MQDRVTNVYLDERKEWIRKNCVGISCEQAREIFNKHFNLNVTHCSFRSALSKYKIKLNFYNQKFKKGHIPWNKGKTNCTQIRSSTQFQKGRTPYNISPVGSRKFERGFWYIKTELPSKWELEHHVVWKKANGPIPERSRIIFKDNDHNNLDINNLLLITESESMLMNLNGYISNNSEITEVGHKICKLNLAIRDKEKEIKKNAKN